MAAQDASTFDVLGFKLGMTPDQVEQTLKATVPDINIEREEGTLSLRGYTTDNLLFGFDANQPRDSEGNSQSFRFTFDVTNNGRLLNIYRHVEFAKSKSPSVDTLKSSLTEKYGAPVTRPDTNALYWYANADPSVFKPSFPSFCPVHVIDSAGNAFHQTHGNFDDPGKRDIKCGIWMKVEFETYNNNDRMVNTLDIGYGDITALGNESLNLIRYIHEQEQKQNAEHPNTNKPPL